ncbi:hypothetical protein Pve01_46530 [Planomonospora venezuelensis]|nr:hypothetical protein Pve01_46530 [Planomonospora venezuelensis]
MAAEDLGDWATDDDLIRNGLWEREGTYGHADAVLDGAENWDYTMVELVWLDHITEQLAAAGIGWDPATAREVDGGPVTLPAGMSVADAAARWAQIRAGFDGWISAVVAQARDGVSLAPPGGVRPDHAPGACWITVSASR